MMLIEMLVGGEHGLWIQYEVVVSRGMEEFTSELGEDGFRIYMKSVGDEVTWRQNFTVGFGSVRFLGSYYDLRTTKDYLRLKSAMGVEIATAVLT